MSEVERDGIRDVSGGSSEAEQRGIRAAKRGEREREQHERTQRISQPERRGAHNQRLRRSAGSPGNCACSQRRGRLCRRHQPQRPAPAEPHGQGHRRGAVGAAGADLLEQLLHRGGPPHDHRRRRRTHGVDGLRR